ncbi:hypothetical protein MMC07_003761 [Pseudocyphellaria aurata]|nr:hypothetical protein [Pseudocyphellaria aurata]
MSTCEGKTPGVRERERALDADYEKLRKALEQNARSRDRLYGRRLLLKEKRNELRQERASLVDADNNFMKSIRRFPAQDHLDFEHEDYVQLEKQRDLVGSLQYEYDRAEDDFDIEETVLSNEEGKLNVLLSRHLSERGETATETATEPSLEVHLLPEEPQGCNDEDEARARLAEYQSRVGDARIMEERLQDLLSEKEERDWFAERRDKFGVNTGASEEDIADCFDGRYAGIVDELGIIHADIERLKDGLIQAGHVFPTAEPSPACSPVARPRPSSGTFLQSPQRTFLSLPCFPVARLRSLSGTFLQRLPQNFAQTRLSISRWILNTFGSSPIECARHKEILRGLRDESLDDEEWVRLVLQAESDHNNDSSWENRDIRSGSPVLLSGRIEATHAMNDFRQQFRLDGTLGEHARPYAKEVELDELSEEESRSV